VQPVCRLNRNGVNRILQTEQALAETKGIKPHLSSWALPTAWRLRHAIDTGLRELHQDEDLLARFDSDHKSSPGMLWSPLRFHDLGHEARVLCMGDTSVRSA
jgi:hypothetical protein